jgi:radical SAM-linked protein
MRLRAEYCVGSDLRFLANLDMMHLMERTLRRAGIPYLLSEGFNPHIRLSMGTVLPVGLWGEKEYFDLELKSMSPDEFMRVMNDNLPSGMHINSCREIPPGTPSLMKEVNAANYAFMIEKNDLELESIIKQMLSQSEILVQSKGKNKNKQKDLRPGIYGIEVEHKENAEIISVQVSVNEPVNIRFDEIMDAFATSGIKKEFMLDFWRQENYIKKGDKFYSPIEI